MKLLTSQKCTSLSAILKIKDVWLDKFNLHSTKSLIIEGCHSKISSPSIQIIPSLQPSALITPFLQFQTSQEFLITEFTILKQSRKSSSKNLSLQLFVEWICLFTSLLPTRLLEGHLSANLKTESSTIQSS
jgi:hypothetical protein